MQELLNNLKGDLCLAGITNNKLASSWGISPSGVSDVFKGRRQMRFSYLSTSLALLNKGIKTESEFISKYAEIAKPKNKREIMEYLSLRGDFQSLNKIIEKEKESKTSVNKEWANVYDLIYKRYTEKVELLEFYNLMREKNKKTNTLEMKVLIDLLLCQLLYQTGNHELISNKMDEINSNIKLISNKFIEKTFDLRLKEAEVVLLLRNGNIEEARNKCKEMISVCQLNHYYLLPQAIAYFKLGESYIFEDYEKSKKYLLKAYTLFDGLDYAGITEKRKMFQYTLSFLKIYHGKEMDTLKDVHKAELAFLKIRQGFKEEAERMLMELKDENGELSAIQTVYLAMARDSKTLMKDALESLLQKGDIFYSQLAKIYLGYY
ncbi:AimR family lysis-lysogeny pheromone receptor [Bacillus cereus group sp. BfR-BA-01380]|uniref:AimR family lysis-lysogeny pheromone receptor n=1 Tax=Bacillus cereus group sp. BfR-BA-01380 TaxID=2920324 RepID=UPI001F57F302|nr:AimR family lysis-lysogeny pheromone receptor [Bacillus cereus group sp. BfR-BA-01380]